MKEMTHVCGECDSVYVRGDMMPCQHQRIFMEEARYVGEILSSETERESEPARVTG